MTPNGVNELGYLRERGWGWLHPILVGDQGRDDKGKQGGSKYFSSHAPFAPKAFGDVVNFTSINRMNRIKTKEKFFEFILPILPIDAKNTFECASLICTKVSTRATLLLIAFGVVALSLRKNNGSDSIDDLREIGLGCFSTHGKSDGSLRG